MHQLQQQEAKHESELREKEQQVNAKDRVLVLVEETSRREIYQLQAKIESQQQNVRQLVRPVFFNTVYENNYCL